MERVLVNGVELEYDVHGSGEPVLLVHGGLLADENTPLAMEPALTDRYLVINYHRRGFAGSSRPGEGQPPATIETHVQDAKALLDELGVEKTHVVGHSLGGTISIQLALDHPASVHTLALMEPAIMAAIAKSQASPEEAVQNQKQFMDGMAHVNEIYATGDKRAALTAFLETRAGQAFRGVLDWLTTTGEKKSTASSRNGSPTPKPSPSPTPTTPSRSWTHPASPKPSPPGSKNTRSASQPRTGRSRGGGHAGARRLTRRRA